MFGDKHSIKDNLSLAIQFSPISSEQEQLLRKESINEIPTNVRNFIATFESESDDEELKSLYYSYRIVYIPIQVNRANQADKAIEFISPNSDKAKNAKNKKYNYGVKVSKQWYWYENWIYVVRDYCQKNNFQLNYGYI